MLNELQMVGLIIAAVVILGGFIGLIIKFIQPINELRIVIQKLIDTIDNMKSNDEARDKRLDKHDADIDQLNNKVGKIETKMQMYHKEG